jgi:hypothetical protein
MTRVVAMCPTMALPEPGSASPVAKSPSNQPDRAPPIRPAPAPASPAGGVSNRNCTAACAAVQAPIMRGQPGYSRKLGRDEDGIARE